MPSTSQPWRVASFVMPEMTLLMPGAGPPPQTIATTFLIPIMEKSPFGIPLLVLCAVSQSI